MASIESKNACEAHPVPSTTIRSRDRVGATAENCAMAVMTGFASEYYYEMRYH